MLGVRVWKNPHLLRLLSLQSSLLWRCHEATSHCLTCMSSIDAYHSGGLDRPTIFGRRLRQSMYQYRWCVHCTCLCRTFNLSFSLRDVWEKAAAEYIHVVGTFPVFVCVYHACNKLSYDDRQKAATQYTSSSLDPRVQFLWCSLL